MWMNFRTHITCATYVIVTFISTQVLISWVRGAHFTCLLINAIHHSRVSASRVWMISKTGAPYLVSIAKRWCTLGHGRHARWMYRFCKLYIAGESFISKATLSSCQCVLHICTVTTDRCGSTNCTTFFDRACLVVPEICGFMCSALGSACGSHVFVACRLL